MPARLRVVLTEAEDLTLAQLPQGTTVAQRTRDRTQMIRLNAQGWNVPEIAKIFLVPFYTVRSTLRRWENQGLGGLWEMPGRGAKGKWFEGDLANLEQCLDSEVRTYNSVQLSEKLLQLPQVQLRPDRLRRLLKKRGGDGRAHAILIKENKTH
ncbi:MAG: helix-turn-helix domain-containing protein [Nostoc sp.]|uniref:helix-turn-helix domain-containing protein n=1 Tax=Nostoc sp. TaxID=1180 RepID=UPI002FF73740